MPKPRNTMWNKSPLLAFMVLLYEDLLLRASISYNGRTMSLYSTIIHQWLHIPYRLAIRYKRMRWPFSTTYVLIHGLADTGDVWRAVISELPKKSNYIVVDLLGHGQSPHPNGDVIYSADEQARNVMAACMRAGVTGPIVLIGHSFGSLVAVEFARRYHGIVQRMVLVSPPIYRDETKEGAARLRQDTLLRNAYEQVLKRPEAIIKGYALGARLRAVGFSHFQLNRDNFNAFAATLRSGIISQQTGRHLLKLKCPITIIYGTFDPVLVPRNFTKLAQANHSITLQSLPTGHAVTRRTVKAIMRFIVSAE